jgi:phage repressor protein C with HTH and peptisase S24 domain
MGNNINTLMYQRQYITVFDLEDTNQHTCVMTTLRKNLEKEMMLKSWNAYDLANKSSVPQPTIQRFLKGKIGDPRAATVRKLAKGLGTTEAALRGFDNAELSGVATVSPKATGTIVLGGFDVWDDDTPLNDDEVALPFFREVELSAGSGRHQVVENHGRKLRFAKSTLRKSNVTIAKAACVTVSGNSMEPVLPNGCVVGIDTDNKYIVDGKPYAINYHGDLLVKRLYKIPGGGFRLNSFNSEYPDINCSADDSGIIIIGKVFWSSRLW